MFSLSLAIVDSDEAYASKLAAYFRAYEPDQFFVTHISLEVSINETLANNPQQIILMNEEIYKSNPSYDGFVILLTEDMVSPELMELPSVFKYQSGRDIVTQVLRIFAKYTSLEKIRVTESMCKVVGVFSPIGGVGKTTISFAIGNTLASKEQKTLYISLESFPSTNLFIHEKYEDTLSDLIFYARKKVDNIGVKVESIARKNESIGLYCIPPIYEPEDMNEIDVCDMEYILSALRKCKLFDYVIIDIPSQLSDQRWLSLCDEIILLTNMGYLQNQKLMKWYEWQKQKGIRQKYILCANFTRPSVEEEREVFGELKVSYYIPYLQELMLRNSTTLQLTKNRDFEEVLNVIAEEVMGFGIEPV